MRSPSDIPLANEVPRPAGEGNRVELFLGNSGTLQGCIDDGDYVLLVGARGEFGNNAAIFGVDVLRGNDVAQKKAVGENGSRSVVARRFDSQNNLFVIFHIRCKVSDFSLIRDFFRTFVA